LDDCRDNKVVELRAFEIVRYLVVLWDDDEMVDRSVVEMVEYLVDYKDVEMVEETVDWIDDKMVVEMVGYLTDCWEDKLDVY